MPSLSKTVNMLYDADLIHHVIMDIQKYPDFLPWCNTATIVSRDEDIITAELTILFQGLQKSYISKIRTRESNSQYCVEVEAISGPFRYLRNSWSIEQKKKYSKIDFFIDFELKSVILDNIMGLILAKAVEKMIHAFEIRVKTLSTIRLSQETV